MNNPRRDGCGPRFREQSLWCATKAGTLIPGGGWTNPSEKYAQVKMGSSSPRFGVKMFNIFELPPSDSSNHGNLREYFLGTIKGQSWASWPLKKAGAISCGLAWGGVPLDILDSHYLRRKDQWSKGYDGNDISSELNAKSGSENANTSKYCMPWEPTTFTRWWFQPVWKICSSKWII